LIRYGLPIEYDAVRSIPALLLATMALALLMRKTRLFRVNIGITAGAIVIAWIWFSTQTAASSLLDPLPAHIRTVQQMGPQFRILSSHNLYFPNLTSAYGVASLASRNPVQSGALENYVKQFIRDDVSSRMFHGIDSNPIETVKDLTEARTLPTWNDYLKNRNYLNLVGINLLVDNGSLRQLLTLKPELSQDLRPVFSTADVAIYNDQRGLPRAYFSSGFDVGSFRPDGATAQDSVVLNHATRPVGESRTCT